MKNKNDQIIEFMGWDYGDSVPGRTLRFWDSYPFEMHLFVADALEQRMVDDGWRIFTEHDSDGIDASALHPDRHEDWPRVRDCKSRPAAIVELFCKVYGIAEE